MKPIDLARSAGVSPQAVRNYEAHGLLPPALRSPSGYRVYEQRHRDALHAFLLLVRAVGYRLAKPIMMAITKGNIDDALTHLDAAHASLTQDREALGRLEKVLASAAADRPAEATTDPLTIGELARKLGVTPTTLRSWEKAGALTPRRHPTGSREYQPKDVRDAHLVHMLRRGHVPLPHIVTALEQIHYSGNLDEALAQVQGWRARVNHQSRHLLAASARIEAVVGREDPATLGPGNV